MTLRLTETIRVYPSGRVLLRAGDEPLGLTKVGLAWARKIGILRDDGIAEVKRA